MKVINKPKNVHIKPVIKAGTKYIVNMDGTVQFIIKGGRK